jgi:hypothetical protein
MDIVQERAVVTRPIPPDINWSAVMAGAIAAAGLSFVLLTFGAGVGLAVSSTAPTWRDTSTTFVVLSAAWLIFSALLSFSLAGYFAGRLRARLAGFGDAREIEFRDGMHGLLAWAFAIVIGAVIAVATAQPLAHAVAGSSSGATASETGAATLAYELDKLFRSDRVARADMTIPRAEASRILLMSDTRAGVSPQDHDDLIRMISANADVAPQEAGARVDTVIPEAKLALQRARESAITLAFSTAAALMIGAIVAWLAAREGGREREIGGAPNWKWTLGRPVG